MIFSIYEIGRLYPFIAFSGALITFEVGLFLRRKKYKSQWIWWAGLLFFTVTGVLWFYFRGDKHSDEWIKWLFLIKPER